MKILMTGGAGFQGSYLVEHLLAQGHEITVLNTYSEEASLNTSSFGPLVSIVWGSVTDPEIVEKTVRGHEVVIHMAARINVDESIKSPSSDLAVNVNGTYNVLEAVRQLGGRLIYASSCEVYGADSMAATSETAELRPHSPYAASKAAADRLCFAYHKTYGLEVTIVRPCNIYGPRQKSGVGGAVIPIFVDRGLANKPLVVFGNGQQRREYMHIDDLVVGYDIILQRSTWRGDVFNLGTGDTPSIQEIADYVAGKTGVSVEYTSARPGEVPAFRLNNQKASELGFTPHVPFFEGLQDYIESRKAMAVPSRSS
jgi:dTDP-glucose 4,6-dehydratase